MNDTKGAELISHCFPYNKVLRSGFSRMAARAQVRSRRAGVALFDEVLGGLYSEFSAADSAAFSRAFREETQRGEQMLAAYVQYVYFSITNPEYVPDMRTDRRLMVPLKATDISAVVDRRCACPKKPHGIEQLVTPVVSVEDAWVRNSIDFTPVGLPELYAVLSHCDLLCPRAAYLPENFGQYFASRHRLPGARDLQPPYLSAGFHQAVLGLHEQLHRPCPACSEPYDILSLATRYEPDIGKEDFIDTKALDLNSRFQAFAVEFGPKLKYYPKLVRLTGLRSRSVSADYRQNNLKPWWDLYRMRIILNLDVKHGHLAQVQEALASCAKLILNDKFRSEVHWQQAFARSREAFLQQSAAPGAWVQLPHLGYKKRPVAGTKEHFMVPYAFRRIDGRTYDPSAEHWSYPVEIQILPVDESVRQKQAPFSDAQKWHSRREAARNNWGPREWALFTFFEQTGIVSRFPGAHGEPLLTLPQAYAGAAAKHA